MKLPEIDLPQCLVIAAYILVGLSPSWVTASAFLASILYTLGVRLITYRRAQDVRLLVQRMDAIEVEAKRALTIATAQGRAKAQGF